MEGRGDKKSSYKGGDVTSPSVFIYMFSYVCPSTEPRFLSLSMCAVCVYFNINEQTKDFH